MSPASYQTAPPRADILRSSRPSFACARAGNGTRTRDPNLGKVVLYQLSYSRVKLEVDEVSPNRPMEARGIEPLTS